MKEEIIFIEALNGQVKSLEDRISELIEEQKQSFKNLLKTNSDLEFLFINQISSIAQRDDNIIHLHNAIEKLKNLKTQIIKGSKRKILPNGDISDITTSTYEDLKADNGKWLKEKKCTKEQMWDLFCSIYNKDKKLFFETLNTITDNKSLTDRYTKLIFGTSLKH